MTPRKPRMIPPAPPPYEPTPQHLEDLRILGEALQSESEERDWCDDYDDFVLNVNLRLHVPLPTPVHTFTIRLSDDEESGFGSYSERQTVEVEAEDVDAAIQLVVDAWEHRNDPKPEVKP